MPAVMGRDQNGRPIAKTGLRVRFVDGLFQHSLFHRLPFAVQLVQTECNAGSLVGIVRRQQFCSQCRVANPPARVDARAQHEAQMPRSQPPLNAGNFRKGGKPLVVLRSHHFHAPGHECTVDADQRHHIANRAERHEVKQGAQVGAGVFVAEDTRLAQMPVQGHEKDEHNPRRAQMPLSGKVVVAVRVHQRGNVRQRVVGLVMVENDHIDPGLPGDGQRLVAGGPAIDGHDQLGAPLDEFTDGRRVRPVPLEHAVGNVDFQRVAEGCEKPLQQRCGRGTVDIVVTEYGNALAPVR